MTDYGTEFSEYLNIFVRNFSLPSSQSLDGVRGVTRGANKPTLDALLISQRSDSFFHLKPRFLCGGTCQ